MKKIICALSISLAILTQSCLSQADCFEVSRSVAPFTKLTGHHFSGVGWEKHRGEAHEQFSWFLGAIGIGNTAQFITVLSSIGYHGLVDAVVGAGIGPGVLIAAIHYHFKGKKEVADADKWIRLMALIGQAEAKTKGVVLPQNDEIDSQFSELTKLSGINENDLASFILTANENETICRSGKAMELPEILQLIKSNYTDPSQAKLQ